MPRLTSRGHPRRRPRAAASAPILALCAALLLTACGGRGRGAVPTTTTTVRGTPAPGPTAAQEKAVAAGAALAATDPAGVEWLCRPGAPDDPCVSDMTATVVPASGPVRIEHDAPAAAPPVDCFYVYPTVSTEPTPVADLRIQAAETGVARAQASRFSQVCRVFAPVYPQMTVWGLTHPGQVTPADLTAAYAGVATAWDDYLTTYNGGRGVVLIGHSQGAAMLIALLSRVIDPRPAQRQLLVSAIVPGGNATVPIGAKVGGSFQHIPECTTASQTGCVVAYSSYAGTPPADSFFGRVGQGVSRLNPGVLPGAAGAGLEVMCVNPADPSGGNGRLTPYFPASPGSPAPGRPGQTVAAPWITEPGLYRATCQSAGGASWLEVSGPLDPGDPRPVVGATQGPAWGLHLVDVNIALGNLVALVGSEAAAYG